MGSKKKPSKKPSPDLQLEDVVFFIDSSLGAKCVPQGLAEIGAQFITHDEAFGQGTPDVEWLEVVGKNGWVVLTKDVRIRRKSDEKSTLYDAKVAAFFFNSGQARGVEMAEAFKKAMPKMLRILSQQSRPFTAIVNRKGEVRVEKKSKR